MFLAPGQELTLGGAIAAIIGFIIFIMLCRHTNKGQKRADLIIEEVIRFEKNKLAKKKHRWEGK